MRESIMAEVSEQEEYNEKGEKKEFEKYEIDNAVDCLIRAEEIKMNKKLYPLVKEELDKKEMIIGKISSLKDLKRVAKKKAAEEMEE